MSEARGLAVILAEPQIETDRQHDQVREHARYQQDAGGKLLLDQGRRIKGGRREPEDESENADLGGREK